MLERLFRVCLGGLLLTAVGCISSRDTFSLSNGEQRQGAGSLVASPSYVISWNVHKAKDERFVSEVGDLLEGVPRKAGVIFCLQEARSSTYELIKREYPGQVSGHYAPSWHYPFFRRSTGVLTVRNEGISKSTAERISAPYRELYFTSPKVSLRSEFDAGAGGPLQVINCHCLNFVSAAAFEKQLDKIFKPLQGHDHPAIVCGDFNVWNADRLEALRKKAKQFGLVEAENRSPGESASLQWLRGLHVINGYDPDIHLDRFFTRGVKVIDCYTAKGSLSSDHLPVILRFKRVGKP